MSRSKNLLLMNNSSIVGMDDFKEILNIYALSEECSSTLEVDDFIEALGDDDKIITIVSKSMTRLIKKGFSKDEACEEIEFLMLLAAN